MKLFTVGPVEMSPETLAIAGRQVPYFRTAEFSEMMLKIEQRFLSLLNAPEGSRLTVLTASGTGAMECAVMNALDETDRVLVVRGGTFGARFCELCAVHHIPFEPLTLSFGETLTEEKLAEYAGKGFTALSVNMHETSTGQLYDMDMIGGFCRENRMRLIVDAVSAFLVDPIDMEKTGIDLLLTASQKALSLSPGLSFIVLSPKTAARVMERECECKYFDLKDYLINMERGQTPYTPAVGIVYELADRLEQLCREGIDKIVEGHKEKAAYFRARCREIGLKYGDYPLSNGVTPLIFEDGKAYDYFLKAKNEYDLMLTPNGGALSKTVLRIGHMGAQEKADYDAVIDFFKETLGK